jgi:hypothetical protein
MRVLVMAVTKKDVFTAIESLEQQGITATNAAILEITGEQCDCAEVPQGIL